MNILLLLTAAGITLAQFTDYQGMLKMINAARAKSGAPPVCVSDKLNKSAQEHSDLQASLNQMTHDDPNKPLLVRFTSQGFQCMTGAENVAQTNAFDGNEAETLLENDPPHLANIVGVKYTHFGVGATKAADGKVYWTQHFAMASQPNEACSVGTAPPASGSAPGAGQQPGQQPQPPQQQPGQQPQPSQQQQPQQNNPPQGQSPGAFPGTQGVSPVDGIKALLGAFQVPVEPPCSSPLECQMRMQQRVPYPLPRTSPDTFIPRSPNPYGLPTV